MRLVAIAWTYVVLLMALAEAVSANGTLAGAIGTFVAYGVAPLALMLYILGAPARRRARRAAHAKASANPNHRDLASGDAVAPEREEP
jgi:hypothetical protein